MANVLRRTGSESLPHTPALSGGRSANAFAAIPGVFRGRGVCVAIFWALAFPLLSPGRSVVGRRRTGTIVKPHTGKDMNTTTFDDTTPAMEQLGWGSKFTLGSFLFFFFVIGGIAVGDLVGALLR
jgi:hypothetical protein